MFRMMRVRLALSYAGIALLVTISLGAVLLALLRSYYARMELDYLYSNAKAFSSLAAPMLMKNLSKDVQDAQVSNLAFLSQTRVRILDPQKNVLADSGPRQTTKIGFGVVRQAESVRVAVKGGPETTPGSASVIFIQKGQADNVTTSAEKIGPFAIFRRSFTAPVKNQTAVPAPNGGQTTSSQPAENQTAVPVPDSGEPVNGQPDLQYFSADVPVSSGVYGLYLSRSAEESGARSDQSVRVPIYETSGISEIPMGYVELSEGPAYGREIVGSVASGLAVAGGLAILLAIAAGWLASRSLTAPLLKITEATQQMSSGDLSVRVVEADRRDEFGTLGKSFNQMAGRIEDTVQTLRRFLADAAHELQTPLTALRTNLELAKSEENNGPTEAYLGQALEQIERLQRMMTDLLCLSRLESGNGQEAFQPIDLKELVQQLSEPFAARAEQAGQAFELDFAGDVAPVNGNPEKLRSALGNLLDNALKFTPAGGAINVRLYETQDNICVTVSDTGIGIPPEEIEMLYNRFHRGRNASAYPGSGLGLAIVRAIAQAHKGKVEASNNPAGGASFTLCLPKTGAPPEM